MTSSHEILLCCFWGSIWSSCPPFCETTKFSWNVNLKAISAGSSIIPIFQYFAVFPFRQETLLKMSEDKQREKLQKERAKLLEATFITPPNAEKQIENGPTSLPETEKPKKERTRMRVPIVRRRRKNENRNEINSNDVKDDSSLTPFQVYYFSFWSRIML